MMLDQSSHAERNASLRICLLKTNASFMLAARGIEIACKRGSRWRATGHEHTTVMHSQIGLTGIKSKIYHDVYIIASYTLLMIYILLIQ